MKDPRYTSPLSMALYAIGGGSFLCLLLTLASAWAKAAK